MTRHNYKFEIEITKNNETKFVKMFQDASSKAEATKEVRSLMKAKTRFGGKFVITQVTKIY